LRHLIALDLANNLIKQIPTNVSHLVYLNELSLANNQIAVVPEEICELLSLKEKLEGLDLTGNPIVNLGDDVWKKGTEKYFSRENGAVLFCSVFIIIFYCFFLAGAGLFCCLLCFV
jgi:hypothetical protein